MELVLGTFFILILGFGWACYQSGYKAGMKQGKYVYESPREYVE